jgi:hypothetical protein
MIQIPLKVILDPYEMSSLLGRKGFFENFEVLVRERKKRIDLTRVQR